MDDTSKIIVISALLISWIEDQQPYQSEEVKELIYQIQEVIEFGTTKRASIYAGLRNLNPEERIIATSHRD